MDPITAIVCGVLGAMALSIVPLRNRSLRRSYARATRECAVRVVGDVRSPVLRTRVGFRGESTGEPALKVELGGPRNPRQIRVGGIDGGAPLVMTAAGVGSGMNRPIGQTLRLRGRLETGDAAFDRAVLVEGPEATALALLSAPARQALVLVFEALPGAVLSGGWLVAAVDAARRATDVLPLMLRAGESLAAVPDVPEALAANATGDPEPGVRVRNLEVLTRDYPDTPLTREALRRASGDSDGAVAVRAARALGEPGHGALLRVAEHGQDGPAAEAVRALGEALTAERALRLFDVARRVGRMKAAAACIDSLGSRERLAEGAEALLVDALSAAGLDVPRAAAGALGRLGTPAAVLPLQEAAAHRGGVLRGVFRDAAEAIQARRTGAVAGQVSLVAEEDGRVSLADDPAGRVSLPPRDEA